MFFKKAREIAKLNEEKYAREKTIENLQKTIEEYRDAIFEIQTYYKTPDGCIQGPYCKGCIFSKEISITEYKHYSPRDVIVTVCGKNGICKNFIQNKAEEN